MTELIIALIASLSTFGIIMIFILYNPEKIEKWASMIWYCLSNFGWLFKSANKKAIKLDLQGNLNDYIKNISKQVKQIGKYRVKVELIEDNVDRNSILSDGKVILRLRKNDPNDLNFVHGSYLFVSSCLLHQVRKYISKSQREALDLFVTTKLMEKERPNVVSYFLDEYLHPQLRNTSSKKSNYYDKYNSINENGYFYPVLLEELDTLGQKVFGKRKNDIIVKEVDDLIDKLVEIGDRRIGEDTDLNFTRQYCRFAILIVGKQFKIRYSTDPYIKWIREHFLPDNIETIYMLAKPQYESNIRLICQKVGDIYWEDSFETHKITLHFNDHDEESDQLIVVLRKIGAQVYQP